MKYDTWTSSNYIFISNIKDYPYTICVRYMDCISCNRILMIRWVINGNVPWKLTHTNIWGYLRLPQSKQCLQWSHSAFLRASDIPCNAGIIQFPTTSMLRQYNAHPDMRQETWTISANKFCWNNILDSLVDFTIYIYIYISYFLHLFLLGTYSPTELVSAQSRG